MRWLAHLIKQYLASTYAPLRFDEAWLCPSAACHAPLAYYGDEFPLEARAAKPGHVCAREGCWHFLGKGHSLEPMRLQCRRLDGGEDEAAGSQQACTRCGKVPYFPLRAGGGFGWASREDAEMLRGGLAVAQPKLGLGVTVSGER